MDFWQESNEPKKRWTISILSMKNRRFNVLNTGKYKFLAPGVRLRHQKINV